MVEEEQEEEEEEEEQRQEVAVGRLPMELEIPAWWVHFVGPVIVCVCMMYRVSHKTSLCTTLKVVLKDIFLRRSKNSKHWHPGHPHTVHFIHPIKTK